MYKQTKEQSDVTASYIQAQKVVNKIAMELQPSVKSIESGFKTTKNNYGLYMSLISKLSEGKGTNYTNMICAALIVAGANKIGVMDARSILLNLN